MKGLLSILLFWLAFTAYSQFDASADKLAVQYRIKEYKVINQKPVNGDTALNSRVMEWKQFNKDGRPTCEYTLNLDVVYTIDSTVYSYNEKGNPVEMMNYFMNYPIGEVQKNYLKETGAASDTLIRNMKYFYNSKDQLIKKDWYEYGEYSFQVLLSYDSEGRLSGEECKHFILPESNNYKAVFQYNSSGKLIHQKVTYPNDGNRVEEQKITYNAKGNILKDEQDGKYGRTETIHAYDAAGRLIEQKKETTEIFGKKTSKTLFRYDAQGNLIELKEYDGEELFNWRRYKYNEKGLKSEELTMNVKLKTKEEIVGSVLYEYSFYE